MCWGFLHLIMWDCQRLSSHVLSPQLEAKNEKSLGDPGSCTDKGHSGRRGKAEAAGRQSQVGHGTALADPPQWEELNREKSFSTAWTGSAGVGAAGEGAAVENWTGEGALGGTGMPGLETRELRGKTGNSSGVSTISGWSRGFQRKRKKS